MKQNYKREGNGMQYKMNAILYEDVRNRFPYEKANKVKVLL